MGWVWAAKWALDGMLNIYETLFRVSLMVLMDGIWRGNKFNAVGLVNDKTTIKIATMLLGPLYVQAL